MPRPFADPGSDSSLTGWTLIAGLGNPGAAYAAHRHNIGFQCVDALAAAHAIPVTRKRFKALVGEGQIEGQRVVLIKPQTWMNDSGVAVAPAAQWFKVPPARLLVIYDDLDLPFGRIRLRPNGSSGGHNGIRSIIAELGSQEFPRLRVGIGRPQHGDPIDYVLNAFDREQAPYLPDIQARVVEIVRTLLRGGIREAMNLYNGLGSVAEPAAGEQRTP